MLPGKSKIKKLAIGIAATGTILCVAGFVLMLNRLLSIYGSVGQSDCMSRARSICDNNLSRASGLIHFGHYLFVIGIILAGLGGLLLMTLENRMRRR